jgi:hypothetical protein
MLRNLEYKAKLEELFEHAAKSVLDSQIFSKISSTFCLTKDNKKSIEERFFKKPQNGGETQDGGSLEKELNIALEFFHHKIYYPNSGSTPYSKVSAILYILPFTILFPENHHLGFHRHFMVF